MRITIDECLALGLIHVGNENLADRFGSSDRIELVESINRHEAFFGAAPPFASGPTGGSLKGELGSGTNIALFSERLRIAKR